MIASIAEDLECRELWHMRTGEDFSLGIVESVQSPEVQSFKKAIQKACDERNVKVRLYRPIDPVPATEYIHWHPGPVLLTRPYKWFDLNAYVPRAKDIEGVSCYHQSMVANGRPEKSPPICCSVLSVLAERLARIQPPDAGGLTPVVVIGRGIGRQISAVLNSVGFMSVVIPSGLIRNFHRDERKLQIHPIGFVYAGTPIDDRDLLMDWCSFQAEGDPFCLIDINSDSQVSARTIRILASRAVDMIDRMKSQIKEGQA